MKFIEIVRQIGISNIIQLMMVLVTGISIIVSIIITNSNTNKQIRNQNKETYRPRLKLLGFENKNRESNVLEYIAFTNNYKLGEEDVTFYTDMELENIGYGLANDITFYNLYTGDEIVMCLTMETNENQKMFSTEEIQKGKKQKFSFCISADLKSIKSEEIDKDTLLIICNYKDLNNNNYKILIGYSIKKIEFNEDSDKDKSNLIKINPKFDRYYCQENTYKYNKMIKKYNKSYNKIRKNIKKKDKILK